MEQQQGIPTTPVYPANNGGDIILTPEKKQKKWPIIAAAIVFVLLIICMLFLIISSRNKSNSGNSTSSSSYTIEDAKKAFNEYTNYLVNGEESSEEIDFKEVYNNYSPLFPYTLYIEKIAYNEKDLSTLNDYYKSLNEKLDRLVEIYNSIDTSEDKYNTNVIKDNYYTKRVLSMSMNTENILNIYKEYGKDVAISRIEKAFDQIDVDSSISREYFESQKELLTALANFFEYAKENNCEIISMSELPECIVTEESDAEYSSLLELKSNSYKKNADIDGVAIDYLMFIYKNLYGIVEDE